MNNTALSVVIATTHPWPELELTLNSLWDQVYKLNAELIIADGDGQGMPPDFEARFPGIILLKNPGASIFILRSMGMQRARGEIVVITEDHCRFCPGWFATILESHRRHPEADIIGGVVENGSSSHALADWANFFIAHGPMMAPAQGGESSAVSLAGAAFKRRALPKQVPSRGVMEMLYVKKLRHDGGKLFTNSEVSLDHVQSYGFWKTFGVHYHNGRAIAGFRKVELEIGPLLLRLGFCAVLPAFLLVRSGYSVIGKKRRLRELLLSSPIMIGLAICHAAGEFVGYCFGAGDSPRHLS